MDEVNNNFKVYPNPVSDEVTISFPNSENIILEVYSVTGKRIFVKPVTGLDTITVNVSEYASGMYFVKLTGSAKELNTKFVVK
jgi:hypothetical protein